VIEFFIDQSVTIVPEEEKKEHLNGLRLVTRKKPHVINAALVLNIPSSLMFIMQTEILVTANIQT